MNIRTAENIFATDTTGPIADIHAEQSAMPEETFEEAPTAERFLLCSKSDTMADLVRRSLGDADDVAIEVAGMSLIELAESDLSRIGDHRLLVVEIDPADSTEMTALRRVVAMAPAQVNFLAITPKELTITTARELMEAGVLEVLPMSTLRASQTPDAPQPAAASSTHNGVVVAISQTRGGIGATTLALNLATMLSAPKSRKDKTPRARVALLDLDFQNGDAAASLDIEDNGALIDMLKGKGAPDAAFLRDAMIPYNGRFDVMPTPVEFAPFDALQPAQMAQMIAQLRSQYDYVILGLPRAMVLWLAPVLASTDQMLMVTDTSVTGMRQARRLIDFYTEDNPGLPVEVIISKEKKPLSHPKAVKEAAKFLDKSFDIWLPYDGRAAVKACERGQPMVEVAKRSAVVKPLKQIIGLLEKSFNSQKRRKA